MILALEEEQEANDKANKKGKKKSLIGNPSLQDISDMMNKKDK